MVPAPILFRLLIRSSPTAVTSPRAADAVSVPLCTSKVVVVPAAALRVIGTPAEVEIVEFPVEVTVPLRFHEP